MNELTIIKQEISNLKKQNYDQEARIKKCEQMVKELLDILMKIQFANKIVQDGEKIIKQQKQEFKDGVHFDAKSVY